MNPILGLKCVVLDFETFFDSKNGYTLKKMSAVEYVRDARFKAHGVGVACEGVAPKWITAAEIMPKFRKLDWSQWAVISHNAKFDAMILAHHYGVYPGLIVDTLGMSYAVNGATIQGHSLSALASHYGLESKGTMLTDGIRDLCDFQEKDLSEYCIHDVELTAEIFERMRPSFPEQEYKILDWTVRCVTQPRLAIDVPMMLQASQDEAKRREAFFVSPLALEAATAAQPAPKLLKSGKLSKQKDIEPKKAFASNDLFALVLQHFGYEVPMKNSPTAAKRGLIEKIPALAVGDPEFVDMLNSDDPRLQELCEARVAAKSTLFETRSAKFAKVGATGLWPFDVVYSGAKQTHRLSGGSAGGGNPQNLPSRNEFASVIRRAIHVPAGHKLVVGDFSNIELRVLAWLSRDRTLIEAIKNGRDLYCDFGTMFYGRTITKADTAERFFSKIAVLGLGYGMGAKKFARTVKIQTGMEISQEEAERAVQLYRSTYGAVPALWQYLGNLLPYIKSGGTGSVYTMPAVQWNREGFVLPSGLTIKFPGLALQRNDKGRDDFVYTAYRQGRKEPDVVKLYGGKITENLCQGLAGEICKDAIRTCGFSPAGQVHDELLVVCPDHMAEETKASLEYAMSVSPSWCPDMKLSCEVGIGDNWLDAKQ